MQLQDATEGASVNLYLRGLTFSFKGSEIIRLEDPDNDTIAPILIHELEHVRTLTSPLGALLTSLALRMADLRLVAVERFNNWVERMAIEGFEATATEALQAFRDTERAARF